MSAKTNPTPWYGEEQKMAWMSAASLLRDGAWHSRDELIEAMLRGGTKITLAYCGKILVEAVNQGTLQGHRARTHRTAKILKFKIPDGAGSLRVELTPGFTSSYDQLPTRAKVIRMTNANDASPDDASASSMTTAPDGAR